MKDRKFTLFLMFLILGTVHLCAQYVAPEAGKVYRIWNTNYTSKVICEDYIASKLVGNDKPNDNNFEQYWILSASGSGFLMENAYTGHYAQHQTGTSQTFQSGSREDVFYISYNATTGAYNIKNNSGDGQGMHCDASNNVVLWSNSSTASNWKFEEVNVSQEALSLKQLEYQNYLTLKNNADSYNSQLPTYFTDGACTELNATYAAMSDADLRTAMQTLPAEIQAVALKAKNQTWGKREQEFRIRDYKAYSNPDYWASKLYTKRYNRLNNPTGIYGNAGDVLFVFVGGDIPENASLKLEAVTGTNLSGTQTELKKGLNIVATARDQSMLFIQYIGTTTVEGETLITDYPALKIHIEQGVVNGFFEKGVHTDADWVDISQNLATSNAIQVKGDHVMFHMSRQYITAANCCRNKISDAIGWWDNMIAWQQSIMGMEEYMPSKFNCLGCAISLTSGYQSATDYRTQYAETYITNLLPLANVMSNSDNCWGPAHENGHVHQHAIQTVGTAESSNNLFSNMVLSRLGKYMSRGDKNEVIFNNYADSIPFTARGGGITLRMYWQLFLYFHEAGMNTNFYPEVFKSLRAHPLAARGQGKSSVTGNEDVLLFAKACCDAAQMDLSEFFAFWGFLVPTKNLYVDDYGSYYLTNRQSDIDEFLAYVSKYPKAPAIEFIEDRVKAIPRTDGGTGNKLSNGVGIGGGGDVGHYTDFVDKRVKAEGYLYNKVGTKMVITAGTGAVGFKICSKEGTLLYGSNWLNFELPLSVASQEVLVYAAQADGTDVELKSVAEAGTEEQQFELLKTSINVVNEVVALSDATGLKPGYYFASKLIDLQEVLDGAVKARDQKNQATHSYGEWAELLNNELVKVYRNKTAKQVIYPTNYYSLVNKQYPSYSVISSGNKLRCTTGSAATNASKQWAFIPFGTGGKFAVLNKGTGNYVTSIEQSVQAQSTSSSIDDALLFQVVDRGNGTFHINDNTQNNGAFHCDASHNLVGWSPSATASNWVLTCVVDAQTELFKARLKELLAKADEIVAELVVNPDWEPVEIQNDVTPLNDSLPLFAAALVKAKSQGWEAYKDGFDDYQSVITALEQALASMEGAYRKALYLPEASTADSLFLYVIRNLENGLCWSKETESSRFIGYLRAKEWKEEDASQYWYFLPTAVEGDYYLYNYETRRGAYAVTGKSYMAILDNQEAEVFTLSPDTEKGGFAITTAAGKSICYNALDYLYPASNSTSYWKLAKMERVPAGDTSVTGLPEEAETEGVLMDLQGRPVSHPYPGIYLRNHQKVFVW